MAIDPQHVTFVRRYEPVVYFAPNEPFFPADAKRYIEQCALWRASPPFDNKSSWGVGAAGTFPRKPMIAYGKIASIASEARPGDTYFGDSAFLTSTASDDRFLDLAGWFGAGGPGTNLAGLNNARTVTATTENRFASLQGFLGVDALYDFSHQVIPNSGLRASRFWYHAEVFDETRIREVIASRRELDLILLRSRFPNPLLICYYLFFPARIAPLEGCDTTAIGPRFASFGGEWACIAVLLSRLTLASPYLPRYVGLTSRNIGKQTFQDEERRVGMTVRDWSTLTLVGEHPRIFASHYTHGLYATPGVKALTPFTPDDAGSYNCGTSESLDEAMDPPSGQSPVATGVITAAKVLSIVGIFSAIIEHINGDLYRPFGAAPPDTPPQFDYPPEEGEYGVVVKSDGLPLPDGAQAQQVFPWFFDPATATPAIIGTAHEITISGRRYSFMVDRREADPTRQQVWWPSDGMHVGYNGRWGPQVENDPRSRRSGMRFPDFAQLFLRALQQALSQP